MITPKFKIRKIKEVWKRTSAVLSEHAFLTFLGFLIMSLILTAAVFYKYGVQVKKTAPLTAEKALQFELKKYQDVVSIWQEREKKLKAVESKTYSNPFV